MMFGNTAVVGWGFGGATPITGAGGSVLIVGTTGTNGNGGSFDWVPALGQMPQMGSKKDDIHNINYGLREIMQLRPVRYKLKGTNQEDIGFIAQEIKEIIPEIVYGEEGKMTLSYGQITSVLTKAIQEQQVMIQEQQIMFTEFKRKLMI